ncbi:hypothetical protein O181_103153 [Austropuccinia psidii MF-1]|uniref:Uncharacterized protein n=1 Tax=Austropuccinia psidii MF-1 TaxID=1389203 RepID=A0A9Q3JHP4_9BASI|nr:hypothetical protein [Austropuccinia psidii MF-1]
MSAQSRCYGSGFSNFLRSFPEEELERLLFGYSTSSCPTASLLDWAITSHSAPPSPPALAGFSQTPTDSPNTEMVPDAAQTFYAFIDGEYDPWLFVPNSLSYFLGDKASRNCSIKTNRGYKKKIHPYNSCPRDSSSRAITTCHLH